MATDKEIENEIQIKGLVAPRITPEDIEENILGEYYFTAGDGYCGAKSSQEDFKALPEEDRIISPPQSLDLLTFCVLILRNGFTVTGESACASPENFNEELGRKIARTNAINKIWPLMGYELRSKLTNGV